MSIFFLKAEKKHRKEKGDQRITEEKPMNKWSFKSLSIAVKYG